MPKKPSERAHRSKPDSDLNLTSLMDIITNLMFFLLIFANIIPVVIIDAPLPKIAATAEEVRMAKKQDNKLDLIIRVRPDGFLIQSGLGGSKKMNTRGDGEYPFEDLHKYLVALHQRRPKASEVTLIPSDSIAYEVIVRTMDASREYIKGDPGYKEVPPDIVGKPESQKFNRLFPDVSLGGV